MYGGEGVPVLGEEVSVGCVMVVPINPDINSQEISGGFTSGYMSRISLSVVVAIWYGTSIIPSLFASGPL